jgi:hypothetical protein
VSMPLTPNPSGLSGYRTLTLSRRGSTGDPRRRPDRGHWRDG